MEAFRQTLAYYGLGDLGFEGSLFTWCNNIEGPNFTRERLDRGLANCAWQDLFYSNSVSILPTICSDNNPLLISSSSFTPSFIKNKRVFRYEASWAKQEGCEFVIKRAWHGSLQSGSKADVTRRGLERCRFQLREWYNWIRNSHQQDLNTETELLRSLQASNSGLDNDQIRIVQKELDVSLEAMDLKWRQRAKQRWLKDGDRNTKFFHKCASIRKQKNFIQKLQTDLGQTLTNSDDIGSEFQSAFRDLFTTSNPTALDSLLENYRPTVTQEMNSSLTKAYFREEIELASFM
ncbi:hypothetical protein F2P56_011472 [Juglans regia]|uniref:Uncharacterized protein LOC109011829 n=2 Tax=Juglans regia TaxID=51240 RepID=A0A2I4GXT5_JUGRE|nr:uncharacterized protein LOC109011829 [Juglans regia]KAF5470993.1 hypothetical protein F2P56_011472 [Juglans regia]